MSDYWWDGYRQDCSGFVSMAWNLPGNEWTGSLDQFGMRISKEELQPGDILLFHNPSDPEKGSHVVIFGGWTDYTHSYYVAYEQTRPATAAGHPYAYWSNSDRYVPYRYKGLRPATTGTGSSPRRSGTRARTREGAGTSRRAADRAAGFPGAGVLRDPALTTGTSPCSAGSSSGAAPGVSTPRGPARAGRPPTAGPLRRSSARRAGAGPDADGLPGPRTWALLVTGGGRGIDGPQVPKAPQMPQMPQVPGSGHLPATEAGTDTGTSPAAGGGSAPGYGSGSAAAGPPAAPAPSAPRVPAYPGRGVFRPGAQNAYVTQVGRQLAKKGFGRHYATGPGPRWGEADRRAVEAFQRAQGWRGGAADGYPGPETWRRLFS